MGKKKKHHYDCVFRGCGGRIRFRDIDAHVSSHMDQGHELESEHAGADLSVKGFQARCKAAEAAQLAKLRAGRLALYEQELLFAADRAAAAALPLAAAAASPRHNRPGRRRSRSRSPTSGASPRRNSSGRRRSPTPESPVILSPVSPGTSPLRRNPGRRRSPTPASPEIASPVPASPEIASPV